MLNNGAQTAANNGKPVIIRLGWEANNEGSYPWAATGDGSSWKNCFQRWVDILNPVADATTPPPEALPHRLEHGQPGHDHLPDRQSVARQRLCRHRRLAVLRPLPARCPTATATPSRRGWTPAPTATTRPARAPGSSTPRPRASPTPCPNGASAAPRDGCAEPGIDNPYFIRKMYEFFWSNAADIAFEAYFNDDRRRGPRLRLAQAVRARPQPTRPRPPPATSTTCSATTRARPPSTAQLWGAGLEPPPPSRRRRSPSRRRRPRPATRSTGCATSPATTT